MDKKIIAVINFYNKKHYFDKEILKLPQNIIDEIKLILIKLAEKTQGVVKLSFYLDGEIDLVVETIESHIEFDFIGANLEVKRTLSENRELFNMFSKWFVLNFTNNNIDNKN